MHSRIPGSPEPCHRRVPGKLCTLHSHVHILCLLFTASCTATLESIVVGQDPFHSCLMECVFRRIVPFIVCQSLQTIQFALCPFITDNRTFGYGWSVAARFNAVIDHYSNRAIPANPRTVLLKRTTSKYLQGPACRDPILPAWIARTVAAEEECGWPNCHELNCVYCNIANAP